jgi:hypothetical protein
VHGEELVELVRPDQVVVRPEKLVAHQQRLHAADDQEQQRHQHVHDADLLVIDRGHPLVEDGRPRRRRHCMFLFDDRHVQSLKEF